MSNSLDDVIIRSNICIYHVFKTRRIILNCLINTFSTKKIVLKCIIDHILIILNSLPAVDHIHLKYNNIYVMGIELIHTFIL